MSESVPVRCPACLRERLFRVPSYPCVCGAAIAPRPDPHAPPTPVTQRVWDEEWITLHCHSCGRATHWPHPELGCVCGMLLRIPVGEGTPGADRGTAVPRGGGTVRRPAGEPLPELSASREQEPASGNTPAAAPGKASAPKGDGTAAQRQAAGAPGAELSASREQGTASGRESPAAPGDAAPRGDAPGTGRESVREPAAGGATPGRTPETGTGQRDGSVSGARTGHGGDAYDDAPALNTPSAPGTPAQEFRPPPGSPPPRTSSAEPPLPQAPDTSPAPRATRAQDTPQPPRIQGTPPADGTAVAPQAPRAQDTAPQHPHAHRAPPADETAVAPQTPPEPTPLHPIRTARDAVMVTALYLRRLGYRDIRRADQRQPSGIGLAARGLLAQVDPSVRPASLRDIECLWLTAMTQSSGPVYFSLAGYADDARARADRLGIPLFVLDLTGIALPVNAPADALDAQGS